MHAQGCGALGKQRRTSGGHDLEQENRPQPPEPGAHAALADDSGRIAFQDMHLV